MGTSCNVRFMGTHRVNHKCKSHFMDAKPKLRGDPVRNDAREESLVVWRGANYARKILCINKDTLTRNML